MVEEGQPTVQRDRWHRAFCEGPRTAQSLAQATLSSALWHLIKHWAHFGLVPINPRTYGTRPLSPASCSPSSSGTEHAAAMQPGTSARATATTSTVWSCRPMLTPRQATVRAAFVGQAPGISKHRNMVARERQITTTNPSKDAIKYIAKETLFGGIRMCCTIGIYTTVLQPTGDRTGRQRIEIPHGDSLATGHLQGSVQPGTAVCRKVSHRPSRAIVRAAIRAICSLCGTRRGGPGRSSHPRGHCRVSQFPNY